MGLLGDGNDAIKGGRLFSWGKGGVVAGWFRFSRHGAAKKTAAAHMHCSVIGCGAHSTTTIILMIRIRIGVGIGSGNTIAEPTKTVF